MYFALKLTKTSNYSLSNQERYPILIASVLKPHDDHRMFEKWALFFKNSFNADVHVFGSTQNITESYDIKFHNSLSTKNKLNRIKCLFNYFFLLRKLKPKTVIIETFELILPSFFYWIFNFKYCNFFYDIRENYSLNWKDQKTQNNLFATLGLAYIKLNEALSKIFIKEYFISDAIYLEQLEFIHSKPTTLLKNLYAYPKEIIADKIPTSYLVTGTLSKAYGIELAFDWARIILKENPRANIKFIGHLTDDFVFPADILATCKVITSISPIPHKQILEEIAQAEFLLIAYNWSGSFSGCIPAKIYEGIFLNTKIICNYDEHLVKNLAHSLLDIRTNKLKKIPSNIEGIHYVNIDFKTTYYNTLKEKFSAYL